MSKSPMLCKACKETELNHLVVPCEYVSCPWVRAETAEALADDLENQIAELCMGLDDAQGRMSELEIAVREAEQRGMRLAAEIARKYEPGPYIYCAAEILDAHNETAKVIAGAIERAAKEEK